MLAATFWGLVGGIALVIGALIGLRLHAQERLIALIMGFGSGVLISALAFELAAESFRQGGAPGVVIGLLAGALTFYAGDAWLDHRGGEHRKRSGGNPEKAPSNAGGPIVLGSLLDGIPESVAIGASLVGGGKVSVPIVAAVFLSNVPESLSAATGLRKAKHSDRWIIGLWVMVAAVSAAAAGLGFLTLGGSSPLTLALIQAFAAGAILTMLADTMLPEAVEGGGSLVGLATVLGFTLAFLLSQAQ